MDQATVSRAGEGLRVEKLRASYNGNPVLCDVSFTVGRGKVLAVIGRSGCGKSTLLRCLCALQTPDDGGVWLDGEHLIATGQPLVPPWEIRRRLMMVPQGPCLLPHLTAFENVALGLRNVLGLGKEEARDRTLKIATEFGFERVLKSYPSELSGGEVQRVQLARAVVLEPSVLLLDEVTSALDPQTTEEVVGALRRMREVEGGSGQAMILVTHLVRFALEFADHIVFLNKAIVFHQGSVDGFMTAAMAEETKNFLGSVGGGA